MKIINNTEQCTFWLQSSRVQISESYTHSQQAFSANTAAATTTDAYTLQTRRSGNYPPTSE